MKAFVHPCKLLVGLALVSPGLALAQATGPSGFTIKKFDSAGSVPGLHTGNATASLPAAAGYPGAWSSSCSKQAALVDELEKTVALQSKRIEELETAVKLAGKGGAK